MNRIADDGSSHDGISGATVGGRAFDCGVGAGTSTDPSPIEVRATVTLTVENRRIAIDRFNVSD